MSKKYVIKFVYGFLPVLVIYNSTLLPKRFSGYSYILVVVLRGAINTNEILLNHELTHSKQGYRTLFLHSILYVTSKRYRLKSEIEAYATDWLTKDNYLPNIKPVAYYLYTNYNLGYSYTHINAEIIKYLYKARLKKCT